MADAIIVLGVAGLGFYVLFVYKAAAWKTFSPVRWLSLGWLVLVAVTIATPIHFYTYEITAATIVYCCIWLISFLLGHTLGRFRTKNAKVVIEKAKQEMSTGGLASVGLFGALALVYTNRKFLKDTVTDPVAVAIRRYEYSSGANIWNTMFIFCALAGIIVACVEMIAAVKENRRFTISGYLGIFEYLTVYIIGAGRQGFVFIGISLAVCFVGTFQLVRYRYSYWRQLLFPFAVIGGLAIAYNSFIIAFRHNGSTGDVLAKIDTENRNYDSSVSEPFKDFIISNPNVGGLIAEGFYYFSPQLYGLDYTLRTYHGRIALGADEFPYVFRRIDYISKTDRVDVPNNKLDEIYEDNGLFHHFFRTAVEDVYIDFGRTGGIVFVLVCGFVAGRLYKRAMSGFDPVMVCLIGIICSGCFFTIIFSPFSEEGFAFPLIWIAGMIGAKGLAKALRLNRSRVKRPVR